MSKAKVSICMITYNHANFIDEAIQSVLMQETDFVCQLVIGDDASTDDTRKICQKYQAEYPDKIIFLPSLQNMGMIPNFVRTLKACDGEYIALLEGDDYWTDSKKLQKQIEFLNAHKDYSICFHRMKVIHEDGEKEDFLTNKEKDTTTIIDLAWGNYIYTASCVFRNNLFQNFPESFYTSPVGDYYLHMLNAQYGRIKYIDEIMGVYRIHKGGVWSGTDNLYQRTKWVALQDSMMDVFSEEVREVLLNSQTYHIQMIAEAYFSSGDPNGYIEKNITRPPKSFLKVYRDEKYYRNISIDPEHAKVVLSEQIKSLELTIAHLTNLKNELEREKVLSINHIKNIENINSDLVKRQSSLKGIFKLLFKKLLRK